MPQANIGSTRTKHVHIKFEQALVELVHSHNYDNHYQNTLTALECSFNTCSECSPLTLAA